MRTKAPDTLYIRAPRLNQLNILTQIASNSRLTQAELGRRCELSVAMVNNYMRELCNLGLLEYRRKSSKNVSYYVTPAGEEQITAVEQELMRQMADLFGRAKQQIRDRILGQAPGMLHRVILFGTGSLQELAFHALEAVDVSIVGVCDPDPANIGREWCGREILNPSQIRYMVPDAVIILDLRRTDEIYRSLTYLQERGIRLIRLDGETPETVSPRELESPETLSRA